MSGSIEQGASDLDALQPKWVHDQATIPTVARAMGAAAPVAHIAQLGQHEEKLPLIKRRVRIIN